MFPWLALMRAMMPPAVGPCGPLRATFAPPPALFGPFAAFAPVWAVALDPGRNPMLAAGLAFGPWVAALRIAEAGR